jgi:hypothetical protein
LLPTLKETPVSGRVLAGGANVESVSTADGLLVGLPGKASDPIVSIVVMEFDGPVTITQQPFIAPAPDGHIHLDAFAADLHGGYTGTIRLEGTGDAAHLTHWRDAKWSIEYVVSTPAAGKWEVEAEVIAPADVGLLVKCGNNESKVPVAATGDDLTYAVVSLGTIELPAGQASVEIKGVAEGWKPVKIRKVTLKPLK